MWSILNIKLCYQHTCKLFQYFLFNRSVCTPTEDDPGPLKIRKITSVTATSDISAIDHRSSDTEKYNILTSTQSFDKGFNFFNSSVVLSPWETTHALICG